MEINKIIIGLEVHIELKTNSKMFCGCNADHFGKTPNTQTCPVCLGLPGALPVPNLKAIESTVLLGLALNCDIAKYSQFDRKNYFYPDLPKGYQISQYQNPLAQKGGLKLANDKIIHIRRVHLEEDTAKLQHQEIGGEKVTLIDFNRSGVALMEIVTDPDINSSDEAKQYLEKLQQIVRYLEISDADMEKGSMRCEPNINLEIKEGDKTFYTPIVELKNINSFRFVKRAIDFEVNRQFQAFKENKIESKTGNKQTRGWDETKQITYIQREKEEANDYRYFPEPDIPPIFWTEQDLNNFKKIALSFELPETKKQRFIKDFNLTDYQATILTADKKTADFFDQAVKENKDLAVDIANTIINKRAPDNLTPKQLAEFVLSANAIPQASDDQVDQLIEELLKKNTQVVESYNQGKPQALGVIIGEVKKQLGVLISIERIISKIN